jgi:hypothetical protein
MVIFHLAKRHIAMASMASTARRAAQHQLKRPNVGCQDLLSEAHPLEEKNPIQHPTDRKFGEFPHCDSILIISDVAYPDLENFPHCHPI